ncbi:MAG TPA: PAS domain-containing protein [Candidatus Udaeobacter sp.]|nr:PAS domain-containing protein [Candidatus Udaeobacter sp.]
MKSAPQSFEAASVRPAARNVSTFSAPFEWRLVVIGLWVFAGYYLGAKIGFALTFKPHPISVLWPPNSILVAALLLTPPRIWWFVLLAAFPAHCATELESHVPPLMVLCWFISNSFEAVIGAGLTRYLVRGPIQFTSLRNAGIFCLCVVFAGPFLSSFLDAAFVRWNAWGQGSYWELIRIRFFSNALAALIVAPLIVTWATDGIPSLRTVRRARLLEACVLFLSLFLVSYAVLYQVGPGADSALIFLPLPFLLWAAVRFGSLGASNTISIIGFLAIWSGSHWHGPFSGGTAEQSALSIQIFLIVLAIPMLFLATVIEERATAEAELRETHQRMDLAASAADLGIWVWDIVRDEIWVSEKERALFGFPPADKPDIDRFRKAIHPDDRDSMRKAVENSLNTGMEYEAEHRVILPNGQIRWLATRGRVEFSGDGKPTRMRGVSLDVTRRKLEEEALRESEERFRIVADAAPVLIWMSGADKLCTFFNKPWLEFTGRTLEQEMGNGWTDGVHPEDLPRCHKIYTEAFDARQPFVMQYRLRRHDGEYRWISDQGVTRYNTQGNFAGYIGSCVDVTDLIRKDEALREFEERVVLAAEAAHLGVWELDTTTNELWMSDKARSLFQFDPEARLDEAMHQVRVHPDDRALRESAVKHAIETDGEYAIEYRVLLPDGTLRWIFGRGRCAAGKHGKGKRLIGVSVDITPQKEVQDLFRLAAEGSHLGVWHWDEIAKRLTWDGATRDMFGVSADGEITIDTFYRALHPDDAERVKQTWRRALELRLPIQLEYRTQKTDGTIRWVDSRGHGYYDEAGKPLSMTGVIFDITDRKEAELAAQQNREELSHLSRVAAMGELAASIAHELNQPLSGITSNASAGQRFIDRGDVDLRELHELLGDIIADGRRAGDVIRGIQGMVKKGVPAHRRIDLNDIVMSVVRMVKPNAMLHSCELGTFLDPDLPTVEGDPVQLQQVLVNLIINAFDAMRDTPLNRRKVVIATERTADGATRVNVRDHGVGIPEEARERLFDHFFTTKREGLGMGLAIVRSIVQSHHGTIAAENADGGGARFQFTLPASVAALPL